MATEGKSVPCGTGNMEITYKYAATSLLTRRRNPHRRPYAQIQRFFEVSSFRQPHAAPHAFFNALQGGAHRSDSSHRRAQQKDRDHRPPRNLLADRIGNQPTFSRWTFCVA